ncbi:MAG: GSCFA domain-containing protein [Saprospiraceae bacterium]
MPDFRTPIALQKTSITLTHQDNILCLGSCFAQHMAQRLHALKFSNLSNPFGISYHPLAIVKSLKRLLTNELYRSEELFLHQGLWHSFDHHSHFSGVDRALVLQQINDQFQAAQQFLKQTNRLLITLGTAQVFQHVETGNNVANCHKLPGAAFSKTRLPVATIVTELQAILSELKIQLPALEVVFSVSPIRHLRDGHIENQRSKATLILALDQICERLDFAHYFPAYEILLDDLRDYRFYEADMAHPSDMAISYVWKHFSECYFSATTTTLNQEITALRRAAQHRALHPSSVPHQDFLQQQLSTLVQLQQRFPALNFSEEKKCFLQQLSK